MASSNTILALAARLLPSGTRRGVLARVAFGCVKDPFLIAKNATPRHALIFVCRLVNQPVPLSRMMAQVLQPQFQTPVSAVELADIPDPDAIAFADVAEMSFPDQPEPLVSIIIPVYNQWQYTYNCLASVRDNTEESNYEVIIGNDRSSDETSHMLGKVKGITVIDNPENLGFLRNCNHAAESARGRYLLFLNNDTYVTKGWLTALLSLIEKDRSIAAVGAKLLYPDGTLQEAGAIVWSDGSAMNFGRGDRHDRPDYNYVREVDYCSGACLLVDKDLFSTVGGFDRRFEPAYYEETDLCFSLRNLGYKVLYQPLSCVVHYGGITCGTSTSSGVKHYQDINKPKFVEKWHAVLSESHYEKGRDVFRARDRSRNRKHILVVDKRVPTWDKDAGSMAMYGYLKLLRIRGFQITFLPENGLALMPYTADLQQLGIEVLYGHLDFDSWIRANGRFLDVAWLSRPDTAINYIDETRKYSHAVILYFVHDLHYLREQRRYEVEKDAHLLKEAERLKRLEFSLFNKADVVLTPSSVEKDILSREIPQKHVEVIPLYMFDEFPADKNCPPFGARKDMVLLGGFSHAPNIDSALWFVNEIFPKIVSRLPETKLFVIGDNAPDSVTALASERVVIAGYVEDLSPYFERIRLMVAPLRYGAGVKGKIITSMSYGVPVVTTTIGNEGIGLVDGKEAMVADQPDSFAGEVVELYQDEALWNEMSANCIERAKRDFSRRTVEERLLPLLDRISSR